MGLHISAYMQIDLRHVDFLPSAVILFALNIWQMRIELHLRGDGQFPLPFKNLANTINTQSIYNIERSQLKYCNTKFLEWTELNLYNTMCAYFTVVPVYFSDTFYEWSRRFYRHRVGKCSSLNRGSIGFRFFFTLYSSVWRQAEEKRLRNGN